MGFLGKIKKAFDKGGVKIEIDVPETFRWQDGVLPVAVHLTGDQDEERVITAIDLTLLEDVRFVHDRDDTPTERSRRERQVRESATKHRHEGPITLGPGESVVLTVDFPISLSGAVATVEDGEGAPDWVATASTAMNMLSEATRNQEWHRVEARPHVEGFSAAQVASQRIENLRTGESKRGIWRHRFG
jgi:hypothetical protein